MEHRSRAEHERKEDRAIFGQTSDQIERKAVLDSIMQRGSRNVHYHKLILSPASDEPVADLRTWTREVMHELEKQKGLRLTWYAVQHRNTAYPHVHVVIAGGGERLSEEPEGKKRQAVKLDKADMTFLREKGRELSDREYMREIRAVLDDLERLDDAPLPERQPSREPHQDRGNKPLTIMLPGLHLSWQTRGRGSGSESQEEEQRKRREQREREREGGYER